MKGCHKSHPKLAIIKAANLRAPTSGIIKKLKRRWAKKRRAEAKRSIP